MRFAWRALERRCSRAWARLTPIPLGQAACLEYQAVADLQHKPRDRCFGGGRAGAPLKRLFSVLGHITSRARGPGWRKVSSLGVQTHGPLSNADKGLWDAVGITSETSMPWTPAHMLALLLDPS